MVLGQWNMEGVEISLEAFQISRAVILFLFALTMILGEGKPANEIHHIKDSKQLTIFPIATPSIASPGAIMAAVLWTEKHIYTAKEQALKYYGNERNVMVEIMLSRYDLFIS